MMLFVQNMNNNLQNLYATFVRRCSLPLGLLRMSKNILHHSFMHTRNNRFQSAGPYALHEASSSLSIIANSCFMRQNPGSYSYYIAASGSYMRFFFHSLIPIINICGWESQMRTVQFILRKVSAVCVSHSFFIPLRKCESVMAR